MFVRSLIVAAGLALALGAHAQQRLRISNQLPPSSAMSKGLELWKQKLEAATGGAVKVELYHSSQLYKDNEVVAAVQRKNVEMGLVVASQFAAYDPYFAVFDLPGLFTSYEQAIRAIDGELGKTLSARLNKLGVQPMYWAQQGFVEIGTTKRQLAKPADFKGMKLRVHSKELSRMAQLLGAAPTTIAASEVSTALTQGTVDGITTSISSYDARKWFEGAPNITTSHFGLVAVIVVMNQDLWKGLPQNVKSAIQSASQTAGAYSTQTVVNEESELI
ncbi:MAG: TRAP transporter substrate-binding protein, partial [Alphaproteobacteria bacterium]|nr:TRAP transporter substrate-binding protein [Alphaproteobacteria bacterium]